MLSLPERSHQEKWQDMEKGIGRAQELGKRQWEHHCGHNLRLRCGGALIWKENCNVAYLYIEWVVDSLTTFASELWRTNNSEFKSYYY